MIASSPWLPEQGSTFAAKTDFLFDAILWISVVSFVGIVIAMCLFAIWYRRRDGYVQQPSPSHSTALELVWTIVPSIFMVWIFAMGASGYADLKTPKNNAPIIDVTAFQFGWQFTYPNGDTTDTLHLSVNQPVQLRLKSNDVIHSFYVPEFRAKMDVMPGRYHSMWFEPTKIGEYKLYCTEYCGEGHSLMKRQVVVHSEAWEPMMDKFVKWRDTEHSQLENGIRLYKIHCSGCHSYDGKDMTGPTFQGFVNRKHDFADGTSLSFSGPESDELRTYITRSIEYPAEKIVAGRPNQMPNFQGKLTASQIESLIAFIIEADSGSIPSEDALKAAFEKEKASGEAKSEPGTTSTESTQNAVDENAEGSKTEETNTEAEAAKQ